MDKRDFKILIVDDDEIARDVVSSFLTTEGYPVLSAKDVHDAIKLLRIEYVKLVIVDLEIQGIDGIGVLKNALINNPDIPVIILTAYRTLDTALEAMGNGAYDYLIKPFKVQEIIFLAERMYKRAVLINENRELIKHLRDTYRDIEVIKSITSINNPEITTRCIERIERLKSMSVLPNQEADIIRGMLRDKG